MSEIIASVFSGLASVGISGTMAVGLLYFMIAAYLVGVGASYLWKLIQFATANNHEALTECRKECKKLKEELQKMAERIQTLEIMLGIRTQLEGKSNG